MAYVDVHTHLDHPKFKDDLDEVIQRAKDAGVKAIIANGVNPKTNRMALELAGKYDLIKAALGLYPVELFGKEQPKLLYEINDGIPDVDAEIEFIKKNKDKIIALGEIGLDNHWVKGRLAEQKEVFLRFIELGEKLKKPIIVHSRDAEQETIDTIGSSKIKKVVMHCFGGNIKLTKRCADNGWSFSIPPSVVRSSHFQRIVEEVNINQLLTETDAPYLAPAKDQRNEPAFVVHAVKKMAELKKFEEKEVENNIWLNYQRMFL
jgi:TatD DNase family protein